MSDFGSVSIAPGTTTIYILCELSTIRLLWLLVLGCRGLYISQALLGITYTTSWTNA
jgi:hypothetical protein